MVQDTVVIYSDSELHGQGYVSNFLVILSCLVQDTAVIYCDFELPGSGYGSNLQ
jgi:hypothetical protein